MSKSYRGACFCGAVAITVAGEPLAMGYCHCASCRQWSAAPVSAFALWPVDALKVVSGADKLGSFNKTPQSARKWCKACGGHVLTEMPASRLVDVYPAVLPHLEFRPREHIHYQEAVLRIVDSLPKNKDLPKAAGGSGVLLPS
ncbi:MAG TPA: GFA family protein [Gammaproteobacteria bacterium]|nr:GFA family protein [Gammaproteobacteria bacterium]